MNPKKHRIEEAIEKGLEALENDPFLLESYREGERCVLKRRDDYWAQGADGKPMPYMDNAEFIDMDTEMPPRSPPSRPVRSDWIDFGGISGTEACQLLKEAGYPIGLAGDLPAGRTDAA